MKKLIVSIIVILFGMGFAVISGLSEVDPFSLQNPFLLLTCLAFTIQWIAFIPAVILKTEKFYDLTGSISYVICSFTLLLISNYNFRSILLTSLISIWALRLGSFLFLRIKKAGKDRRFDEIKLDPARFFITWNLQGLWISLTSCAAWAGIYHSPRSLELGIFGWFGLFIWILGFSFEVIADTQKSRFKADPKNADKFIQSGLWKLCRHPNYFGEFILWLGIFIISSEVLFSTTWLSVISPIFVYWLLNKVSGVPLLTERALNKWGQNPQWQKYYKETPAFFPKLK